MSEENRDNIEVRLHKDGTLDEIVITDPRTGKCLFHLEQMSDQHFWMRCYGTTQDLVAHINAVAGECDGPPIMDERGFITGYKKFTGPKINASYNWDDSTNESECGREWATPEAIRREHIAEMINKYGIVCVLQEMVEVIRQGRMAEHERAIIADLDNTRMKFIEGDRAYWDRCIAEDYGKDDYNDHI